MRDNSPQSARICGLLAPYTFNLKGVVGDVKIALLERNPAFLPDVISWRCADNDLHGNRKRAAGMWARLV